MASSLLVEGGNGNGNNNNNNNNGSGSGGGGNSGSGGNNTNAVGSGNVSNNNITTTSDDNKSAKYSMNNNNGEDTQSQNDDTELRLKRQTLTQRKHELEMLLNEKSWMLQQIQKQEAQILNGNYEYVNLNEILNNLAKQYKQEQQQQKHLQQHQYLTQQQQHHHHHQKQQQSTGSTAILRRKTASGAMGMSASSKENQNIHNNNNSNNNNVSNRKSEVSNRSSEYDNYPIAASVNSAGASSSSCGNLTIDTSSNMNVNMLQQQHQQMPMKQTMSAAKKRTTTATSATTNYGSYLQQMQQQQLLQQQQQQQQQQQFLGNDQLYLQQYLAEQNYLQQKITSYQQRQQQQQQQLVQQLQQQQQHSNIVMAHDVISLYSVNSANVATLRQQHVSPQQQPQQSTIVQCDRYYLSPTHQSHSNASGCSFIKSSQNIKKYNSPAASPTTTGVSNHGSTMTLGVGYDLQHATSPISGSQHHTLQHYHHAAAASMPATHQLDAISLAPSYAVSMDAAIGGGMGTGIVGNTHQQNHNIRWRSHTNIPTTTSPLISPNTAASHHQQQHYHSHLGVDVSVKSHSSDMLAHMSPTQPIAMASTASINTLSTLGGNSGTYFGTSTATHHQQKGKPLDEISISSLNSTEGLKKPVTVKPKQWLESSLDGPIIRSTPTSEFVEHITPSNTICPPQHHSLHKSTAGHTAHSPHHHVNPKHKLSSQSMSVASSTGAGASVMSSVGNAGSTTGASRHYSMSKHTTNAQRQALQDDTARYAKLSQSTSYLHSLELNNSGDEQHSTPLAYQYLPPKPTQTVAAQPTPPPRPPPALDKSIAVPVAPGLVAAAVANTNNSTNTNNSNNNALLGPDIRIESPKNMTVVQQATFQPYKEVTKPFEMADFYKYSTKFRQKENTPTAATDSGID